MGKKPNILFIFSDQHRHDVLGCAGHPLVQTPGELYDLARDPGELNNCVEDPAYGKVVAQLKEVVLNHRAG